ncbi:MAG: 16S rRNA (uracil(1498)-N(3))-methyltransferase [Bacteroidetes bacterium]|nr:16S rRNA (uracil(1498)-N(3))-methyltransferase [Bacteroidota bacterium]MDA1122313.1 16S rRNA (uracil(1498)-N(3))-methyltransferase [Bacteroidota bacterium]
MQLFFHPNIESNIILDETESTHCIKVLRHKVGDEIRILNGKGKLFNGIILTGHHKKCEVGELREIKSQKIKKTVHIAIAPTKNHDRMEWFVEKATEIGVSTLSFFTCDHSERKKINLDRLEKKAISALKQCHDLWLPEIHDIQPFEQFISSMNNNEGKYIAYVNADSSLHLLQASKGFQEHLILIGPEGDFTDEEVKLAININFKPVSLGLNTLRTETAGIVACTLLNT